MKAKTLRQRYLREAAVMVVLARLALRLVAPARVFAWANRPRRRIRRFPDDGANWAAWAVETIGAKRWTKSTQLTRALAVHAMLRRRGIASRLCLGVARKDDALAAQAWVEVGQSTLLGSADAARVTRIAAFGGEPA
jgi:GNAT superfamily N-acetyltransferase